VPKKSKKRISFSSLFIKKSTKNQSSGAKVKAMVIGQKAPKKNKN
jgi:hypothetical protein